MTPIIVNAVSFAWLSKQRDVKVLTASLADIEKTLKPKPKGDPEKMLPDQYKDYLDVFNRVLSSRLPQHRPGIDHEINLMPDKDGKEPYPPWGPLYAMSVTQ